MNTDLFTMARKHHGKAHERGACTLVMFDRMDDAVRFRYDACVDGEHAVRIGTTVEVYH